MYPSLRKPGLAAKSLWESGPKNCEWVLGLCIWPLLSPGMLGATSAPGKLPQPSISMTFLTFDSQVKIQPVAKYDWEQKYYYGNLIAVSNSFLAYAIRGE